MAGAGEEGGGWAAGQKPSFFAGGEELQGLLEVLDGCAHVLVLQGAASVLAEPLRLGEVLRRELDATCGEDRRRAESRAAVSSCANRAAVGEALHPPQDVQHLLRVELQKEACGAASGGETLPAIVHQRCSDAQLRHFL